MKPSAEFRRAAVNLWSGAFGLLLAALLFQGTAFAQVTNGTPLAKFTKPAPAADDNFGDLVAAVGNDRLLIGAPGDNTGDFRAGAAFLFSINGTLLTTFTNPAPAADDNFGVSAAAVGNDMVLIGEDGADFIGLSYPGAVHLFSTNGVLITTFTNPVPSEGWHFGTLIAALGSDRVIINSTFLGRLDGAVHLFSTNGVLITTITNPNPDIGLLFGWSMAAVGSDRVLIGARQAFTDDGFTGLAYLYGTNGALLTTFTNPTPAEFDEFGGAVAALGSDRVLIGAFSDDAGATDAGVAYLFSTNGTLLTTFTNPAPTVDDQFGRHLTAVGTDRVLIGKFQNNTGSPHAGAAYLFSTNGTLLSTFTNPTPADGDYFGISMAALGNGHVLFGAPGHDSTVTNAGAAYLFSIPQPLLNIARNASTVSISWVWPETGLVLQQAGLLGTTPDWKDVAEPIYINGRTNVVHQTLTATNRFYRLRRP